jgi:hypothetical protein
MELVRVKSARYIMGYSKNLSMNNDILFTIYSSLRRHYGNIFHIGPMRTRALKLAILFGRATTSYPTSFRWGAYSPQIPSNVKLAEWTIMLNRQPVRDALIFSQWDFSLVILNHATLTICLPKVWHICLVSWNPDRQLYAPHLTSDARVS